MKRAWVVLVLIVACGGSGARPTAVANTARSEPPVIDDREAVEDAALQTRTLAFEAYPQWAVAHPTAECPATLAELLEYMDNATTRDRWGTELRMMCGASLPPGVKGIAVQSAGPDRTLDTSDDVKSWE